MVDKEEQTQRSQSCLTQGNCNLIEHLEIGCAVQIGSLVEAFRNCLEAIDHNDQVVGGDQTGQNPGPFAVTQTHIVKLNIQGHQAAGEVHCEYAQLHDQRAADQLRLGQRICHQRSKEQVGGNTFNGIPDLVKEAADILRLADQLLAPSQRGLQGDDTNLIGIDGTLATERKCHNMEHWVQNTDTEQNQQGMCDHINVIKLLFLFQTRFLRLFHHSLRHFFFVQCIIHNTPSFTKYWCRCAFWRCS